LGIAHIYFLIGVQARLSVAINWLWIHMRNQRSARLITQGRIQLDRGGSQDDQGNTSDIGHGLCQRFSNSGV
jgi:hypothetical protein